MSQTLTEVRPALPAAPPRMTHDEFLEWAGEDTHAEWVNGEVVLMSPVSNRHQDISALLIPCLLLFVQERHLGVVRFESFQMKPSPDLPGREPDILFISHARMINLENSVLRGPADLVVEIVSPESVQRDTVDKYDEYQQAGVREYWLIDPRARTALFFVRGEDGLFQPAPPDAEGIYRSVVLGGFWLRVEWLSPPLILREVLREWEGQ